MNFLPPDTHLSLIARLSCQDDSEAWEQFVAIYQPLIFRFARNRGLQDTDAHEITQEVLIAVANAIGRWRPDASKARFRDWLFCITRNQVFRFLARQGPGPHATGDSRIARLLEQEPEISKTESSVFELEYRREVFRWAAERVRDQVKERTWRAFWMSRVANLETAAVAEELGMSVGAVHIACSRVRSRIRDAALDWTSHGEPRG